MVVLRVEGRRAADVLAGHGDVLGRHSSIGPRHPVAARLESYLDVVMVAIVSSVLAPATVILLGSLVASF